MSVFAGATNTTVTGGNFAATSTTVVNVGAQTDIVVLLHSHSATAGLLDSKERFDAPKCDEGTRASMILGMKKFVQDGDEAASLALYWLHGPAGVGKSALAQSLSLLLKSEGDHAASFFFSRTSPGRNNGNQLIITLAYQLATNFPMLQPFMSKMVQKSPAILTSSNASQMQGLIIDSINKWHKKYKRSIRRWTDKINKKKLHPRLILVDGLDECDDPNVQTDLILCIASAVRELSIPLRFVITSRSESHILATFELDPALQGFNGATVTKKNLGEDEDADEQITTFLLKEFAEIRRVHLVRNFLPQQWPHPSQITQLVSKSSKGFIYPATVIRYIKMPHNRPDECLERILGLSEIPTFDKPYEPLDFLYRHIFESVPEANKSSIHNIFHFLVLPSTWNGVTDPETIERHFEYPAGHVQHVLRGLLCLVAFTRDGSIKVLHASLPDFLLNESRSGILCIDAGNAHTTIAAGYLSSICHSDELPSVQSGFADFLGHLMQANVSNTQLRDRILQIDLLSRYKKVCSALGVTEHILGDSSSIGVETTLSLPEANIEGIAFMVAYLLVLLIRCGPLEYITEQITAIMAYIRQIYPSAASVRAVHDKIIPAMTPLFGDWTSTIYHESINHVFASGVETLPPHNNLREDIFKLLIMMMASLCKDVIWIQNEVSDLHERHQVDEQWTNRKSDYWASIVLGRDHSTDTSTSLPA